MIIAMDPDEKQELRQLGHMYKGERICHFADDLRYDNETRLTFLGHASTETFGEHSIGPEDFARHLIEHGLSKNKEVSIDLLGCSIGDINNKNGYAISVARYLYERGFTNVKINALNALVTNKAEEYPQTFLYLPKRAPAIGMLVHVDEATLFGIRKKDYEKFLKSKSISDFRVFRYGKKIYSTADIRFTFDNNKNFQITSENIDMPDDKRAILAIINNRIAELKEEIHHSTIKKLTGSTSEYKKNKLNELIKLRAQLETLPLEQIPVVIEAVLENKKIASSRTLTCLTAMHEKAKALVEKQHDEKKQKMKKDLTDLTTDVTDPLSFTCFFNAILKQDNIVFQLSLMGQKNSSLTYIKKACENWKPYINLKSGSTKYYDDVIVAIEKILNTRRNDITGEQQVTARTRIETCLNNRIRAVTSILDGEKIGEIKPEQPKQTPIPNIKK